jgi:UTP--glucose-1-phosphate uridylyltransferase
MTINKCLFPAAGYGTRFLPATKAVPKEMLPVLTKPLLQYAVEEALSAGVSNMAIVTGRGKRSIEDHFDKAIELENKLLESSKKEYIRKINDITDAATFTYIRQKEMLGLGHAILSGQPLIGHEPFAVNLADDLFISENGENVLFEMINLFKKYQCSVIAIEEVSNDLTHKYGIISGNLLRGSESIFQVDNLIEKPSVDEAPSNLAIVGRYILTPDIFEILKETMPGKSGEIQITDALLEQAKKGNVIAYKHQSIRFDCGSVEGFVRATNYLAKKKGIIK